MCLMLRFMNVFCGLYGILKVGALLDGVVVLGLSCKSACLGIVSALLTC